MEVLPGTLDEQVRTCLLGMAVMRGLVSPEALGRVALLPRREGRDLLDEALAEGLLDTEDVLDLQRLLERYRASDTRDSKERRERPTSPDSPAGASAGWTEAPTREGSLVRPELGRGRSVMDALRLPSWKQYRDLRFLGEGGMGRIYQAFDPVLRREVALKFLSRDEPLRVLRFVLEAQHQARVDHPNVCKVYEVGDWDGQSYIAMQLIKGETLAKVRDDLSLAEIASVMEDVAEAVHAAHRQGLVHRDLKPSNIMVERDDRGLKPFVLDFGLARGMEATGLTQQGVVAGTAGFMSPEQATGDETKVGPGTDIYALGATLYMLLGGAPPFEESTGLELLRRTVEEDPLPLKNLRPDVPRDLETIALKCLEKDPTRRYPSARALSEDLRRFREGEPILAHPPTLAYHLQKRARKHKTLVAVSAVALATVLVFAGFGIQARRNAAAQAQWAQHYGQEAERLEALLRYVHLLPAHDIRPEIDGVRERLARLHRDSRQAPSAAAGPAAYALGRGYLALGELAPAEANVKKALDLGLRTPEAFHVYGRVLGLRYQAELDRIRRIPDPAIRLAQTHAAERRLRDDALTNLEKGRGAALESAEYDKALLAFYGRRYTEALEAARRAFAQTPWFYEAKELEGDILLEQASHTTPGTDSPRLLEEARACYQKARTIAPSDPGIYYGEASTWRLAMNLTWARGETPEIPCVRGLEILEKEQAVDPGRAEIPALEAWFHFGEARFLNNHGKDSRDILKAALESTSSALRRDPANLEALHARMETFGELAMIQWLKGPDDPLPSWDQAIAAGRKAMEVASLDPQLLQGLSKIHLRLMTYQAMHGQDYRHAWEAGKTLMEEGVRAFPEAAAFQLGLGEAHEEWAEQERTHGRDPSKAVQEAQHALDQALRLDPDSCDALYYQGITHMTQGEFQIRSHEDARPALHKALESLARAEQINPAHAGSHMDWAECHLDLAWAALEKGASPVEDLALARAQFTKLSGKSSNYSYCDFELAKCDLMEIRWLLGKKAHPDPDRKRLGILFPRAEKNITRWLKANENNVALGALAELYQRWVEADGTNPRALTLGIQTARKAVTVDPSYGTGYLRLGELEELASRRTAAREASSQAAARARAAFQKASELDPQLSRDLQARLSH